MIVDNFEQIKSLLKFENENEFYFLQIIQRKKDHKDSQFTLGISNNNRLIKAYYIYNIEQLDKYKLEITILCTQFNARAGICLNRRNSKKLSLEMLRLLAENISNDHFNQLGGIYNSVCGHHYHDKDKSWIIDIDDKEFDSAVMEQEINNCNPVGNKIITKIPTRAGYHIITKPFDLKSFSEEYPEIDIHKNNPTILYIP